MSTPAMTPVCPACKGSRYAEYAAVACEACQGSGESPDYWPGQSRKRSLVESLTNTAIGFVISIFTWRLVAWIYEIPTSGAQTVGITAIFTLVSIARGYCVRRWFNRKV